MAPISRYAFNSSPNKTILIDNGAVRVRLMNAETLPYVGKLNGPREALLFDLAERRSDLMFINGNDMAKIADEDFWETATEAGGDVIMEELEEGEEKENLLDDSNLTLEGNPLEIKYDTVEEMRKKVRSAKFTQSHGDVDVRFPIQCNPFTIPQADRWLKRLTFEAQKWLDSQIGNVWVFIANDAADGRKLMLTGMRLTVNDRLMVTLLGKGAPAFKKIATLLNPLSRYSCRKIVSADYEIFKPRPLPNKSELDPDTASFRIHVEWSVPGSVKWLSKPPLDTNMTLTFCPGWYDSRVGFFERSQEIEYLTTLASWLLDCTTEWTSDELEHDIIDEIRALIRSTSVVKEPSEDGGDEAVNDDFTFKLWLILRKCTSSLTLRTCLELILKTIRNNEITAIVGNENTSSIARMLRSAEKKEIPVARLESLTCVGYLLELGVDYMKCCLTKDFLSYNFIQNVADLNNVFLDTTLEIEDQAMGLLPIHLAFQTVNTIKNFVKHTPYELVNLTRRALNRFCSSKSKPVHMEHFVLDVKNNSVLDHVFCDATLSDWCLHRTTFSSLSGKEPRLEHYFHFSNRVEFTHVANRVYLPRGYEVPKLPNLITVNGEELQQTLMEDFKESKYSAKEQFYGAATIISHVRL